MGMGAQDTMMHIDNINTWYDDEMRHMQKIHLNLVPNKGHSSAGSSKGLEIFAAAMADNSIDNLPFLHWEYKTLQRDQDTILACLIRPTEEISDIKVWRGVSETGRDFREKTGATGSTLVNQNIFTEHMSCSYQGGVIVCPDSENGIEFENINDGSNCYHFTDANVEEDGKYSAMWVGMTFKTDYTFNSATQNFMVTSGPLIFPNTYPFDLCPDNGERGTDIDCSEAL